MSPTPDHPPVRTSDRAWRQELVLALRLRDVPGAQIGDALAHVDSYCADSGRSALDEFGPADEYAAGLDLPRDPDPAPTHTVRDGLTAAVGVAGMLLTFAAVDAWRDGTGAAVSRGTVLAVPLILVLSLVLVRHLEIVVRRRAVGVAAIAACTLLVMAVAVLLPGTALVLPVPVALLLGGVLVLAPSVVQARHPEPADVVAGPFEPADRIRRSNRRLGLVSAWILPILTVVGLVLLHVLDLALAAVEPR